MRSRRTIAVGSFWLLVVALLVRVPRSRSMGGGQ